MSKELVSVVDEQDNVIGVKARDSLDNKDIIRVSVLWIENDKGEVLLQQRSLAKKIGPGQWGPAAAGTVESHETPTGNIVKEAEEELGIAGITPIEMGKRLHREQQGPFGRVFTFYRADLNKDVLDFVLQEKEVARVAWVPKTQILADVRKNPAKYVPSAIFWEEIYY